MSNKIVVLLTNLKTSRGGKKVSLPANTTQSLTAAEIETLDKLTVATGRDHYRLPRNETQAQVFGTDDDDDGGLDLGGGGNGGGDDDNGGKAADQTKALDDMTVKDLKEYLDGAPATPYSSTDDKAALLSKAKAKQAAGGGTNEDAMGGL